MKLYHISDSLENMIGKCSITRIKMKIGDPDGILNSDIINSQYRLPFAIYVTIKYCFRKLVDILKLLEYPIFF